MTDFMLKRQYEKRRGGVTLPHQYFRPITELQNDDAWRVIKAEPTAMQVNRTGFKHLNTPANAAYRTAERAVWQEANHLAPIRLHRAWRIGVILGQAFEKLDQVGTKAKREMRVTTPERDYERPYG